MTGVRTGTACSAKPAACRPGVVKKARASMSDGVTGVPIASFKWDAATRKPWNAAVAKLGLGAKPRDFIVELSNTISPLPSPKYVENKLYAARAAAEEHVSTASKFIRRARQRRRHSVLVMPRSRWASWRVAAAPCDSPARSAPRLRIVSRARNKICLPGPLERRGGRASRSTTASEC